MATRPNIQARDSSGNQVSLLNEDPTPQTHGNYDGYGYPGQSSMMRSYSNLSVQSNRSSPRTPGLQRADSYDSNTTDPISPLTPLALGESFGRHPPYVPSTGFSKESQYEQHQYVPGAGFGRDLPDQHHSSVSSAGSGVESDQLPPGYVWHSHKHHLIWPPQTPASPVLQFPYERRQSSVSERTERPYDSEFTNGSTSDSRNKRYSCRYKETHGCEKTFTTSGHASRHSKIHTAEKAVNCTYPGCQKKFTRADNMKQHLETHNKSSKDRSRTPSKSLTKPAGVQKPTSRPSSTSGQKSYADYTPDRTYPIHTTYSPVQPIRPTILPTERPSGLDALANVAASESRSGSSI